MSRIFWYFFFAPTERAHTCPRRCALISAAAAIADMRSEAVFDPMASGASGSTAVGATLRVAGPACGGGAHQRPHHSTSEAISEHIRVHTHARTQSTSEAEVEHIRGHIRCYIRGHIRAHQSTTVSIPEATSM
jgi:hypothetical protein